MIGPNEEAADALPGTRGTSETQTIKHRNEPLNSTASAPSLADRAREIIAANPNYDDGIMPCAVHDWCTGHYPDRAGLDDDRFHWSKSTVLCAFTADDDQGRNETPPGVSIEREADADHPGERVAVRISLDASYDRDGLRRLADELASAADALIDYGVQMSLPVRPDSITTASLCNGDEHATGNINRARFVVTAVK